MRRFYRLREAFLRQRIGVCAAFGGVTTTRSYDALNRLTAIDAGATASYAYNGANLRVSKIVGGVTTNYAWDQTGLGTVLSDGAEYVWGAGLISQVTSAGAATYAHADGLGSIRLLTDATGAVVGTQSYDAFGATRSQTGVQLPFTYTGEQVDPESGLVYLRARYLDPATGRFLTKDTRGGTLTMPPTQHRYIYVLDHAVTGTDPSGHGCGANCEGGSIAGAGGGAGGGGTEPAEPSGVESPSPEIPEAAEPPSFTSKSAARTFVSGLDLTAEQQAAVNRAIRRAGANDTITVIVNEDGTVTVSVVRTGANGFQDIQSTVDATGEKSVVQYGVDANGNVTHLDIKRLWGGCNPGMGW